MNNAPPQQLPNELDWRGFMPAYPLSMQAQPSGEFSRRHRSMTPHLLHPMQHDAFGVIPQYGSIPPPLQPHATTRPVHDMQHYSRLTSFPRATSLDPSDLHLRSHPAASGLISEPLERPACGGHLDRAMHASASQNFMPASQIHSSALRNPLADDVLAPDFQPTIEEWIAANPENEVDKS
jgi:hypothetical protein